MIFYQGNYFLSLAIIDSLTLLGSCANKYESGGDGGSGPVDD